jgi:hypothetical protein
MPHTEIVDCAASVPEHVVQREFSGETVALNLRTGAYHGLNPTAARMVEVMSTGTTVRKAIPVLAREFEQPEDVIERDLVQLCRDLAERDLIELRHAGAR